MWVPFNISVPRDTTLPLDVAVLTQFVSDGADRTGNDRSVFFTFSLVYFLINLELLIFQDGGDDRARHQVL